ncbi:MFS transporter [Rhizobium sp. SGZ-381]|uniref:MFS transporter n=1 Tax=Rhizobium sp. SGZ-381 TaxID=3342800 RepID=UPI0036725F16
MSLTFRRIRLIAAVSVSQIIGWGTSFDMPAVLGPRIGAELGLSNAVVFSGLTIMMLTSGLAGPAVGRLLARHGAARVLSMGSVSLALGLLLLSACHSLLAYAATWLVFGWGGALSLSTAAYAAIVEREGADGKRVIALTMIFTGLSATVFWPVNTWLADGFGWRNTLMVLSALQLFVCLPLHLFALPKPVASQAEKTAQDMAPVALSPAQASFAFLLIAAAITMAAFVSFGLSATFLQLLHQSGATPALALQLGMARGVLAILARGVDFLFGRRGNPILTALVGMLLTLASYILLLALPASSPVLVTFVVLQSLGSGIMAVARAVLPLAVFSPAAFGLQSARISLPQNFAIAAAPVAFAALMDGAGASAALFMATLLSGIVIVLLLQLRRLAEAARAAPIPSPPETEDR